MYAEELDEKNFFKKIQIIWMSLNQTNKTDFSIQILKTNI